MFFKVDIRYLLINHQKFECLNKFYMKPNRTFVFIKNSIQSKGARKSKDFCGDTNFSFI